MWSSAFGFVAVALRRLFSVMTQFVPCRRNILHMPTSRPSACTCICMYILLIHDHDDGLNYTAFTFVYDRCLCMIDVCIL